MKIVSACLVGINCRYDGKNSINSKIFKKFKKGDFIPLCPEQLGGLPTPREIQEIVGGTGEDVLEGKAKVMTASGRDVTKNFIRGAEETLMVAKSLGVKEAILKSKSPACACKKIYDGSFSGKLKKGEGVAAAILKNNNIKVMTEKDI
ncbi:MAG: DUF523 domain-containing protein [Candidatus Aenigmarchaeota archaeon]|nr:DUF523 domain-containing protein [Candidatus Aenigmarchaeota archaeon]NIQ18079.1 DUF523 domain-containing protein [Candidatus Aenigmarchaeota archaeon]